jgi:two-component system, NarL family, sensor kinase
MLDDLESELRRLSHELRPLILDDLGLLPALQLLKEGTTQRTGLAVSLEGAFAGRLSPLIETALYRIVHESLRIAHRTQSRKVRIAFVREESRIQCSIRIEGGEAADQDHGIVTIRQRVEDLSGTLAVSPGTDMAAEFVVVIPLD